jgi:hypothetical protein
LRECARLWRIQQQNWRSLNSAWTLF